MGENIAASRWSDEQKGKLRISRVNATENLIKLIELNLNLPLNFFISSSAVGIYPVNSSKVFDEDSLKGHKWSH